MLQSRQQRATAGSPSYVAPEVSFLRDRIVNVVFVGAYGAGDRAWTLVDAGLPGSASRIREAAAQLFGAGARPAAIILTHGHFDHVGAIHTLADEWDAPVFAHRMELPYLTGRSSYPPADPFVGGGAQPLLSVLFPRRPIDLGHRVSALPDDGSVPSMPGWRWLPTPGHTPGHVSLVRDSDRMLIAGDAFVTTKQESTLAILSQHQEMHGPPTHFTPDYDSARESVKHLADYAPSAAITGHGPPMRGDELRSALCTLARRFDDVARPAHGRYRNQPATADEHGVVGVPPPLVSGRAVALVGAAVGVGIALAVLANRRSTRNASAELAPEVSRSATPIEYHSYHSDQLADDAMLRSAQLATADGGYDATADSDVNPA